MRISLGAKITASFAVIVFLALGIAVSSGNRLIRLRYDAFAAERDMARAEAVAPLLGGWTAEAARAVELGRPVPPPDFGPAIVLPQAGEHWELDHLEQDETPLRSGDEYRILNFRDRESEEEDDDDDDDDDDEDEDDDEYEYYEKMGRARRERGGLHYRRNWSEEMRRREFFEPVLITDTEGCVLLNTSLFDNPEVLPAEQRRGAMAIRNGTDLVGYLYLGRMIPGTTRIGDMSFFRYARTEIWIVSAAVFLAAMVLGFFLTRHIVRPVKRLNRAAETVERGSLDVRVPENRRDELGDLARGFNSMTSSLESADQQRRRLIADSAHELRTPVSLIRTRIEMMLDGIYPVDEDGLRALSEETYRLTFLIEELKTLAALESGEHPLTLTRVDIAALAREIVEAAAPAVKRSGLSIETRVELARSGRTVLGDGEKLHRLLTNLLSNALRWAEGKILIRLYSPEGGNGTVVSVEDDGPGIAGEDRERVFERYYRADPSRSRDSGGTGLGLAICREIVKSHGGEISASNSAELGGAAFIVTLPERR